MKPKFSRFIRTLVIIFLSLTAAMTLLGAIGTTCVAFFAEKFGPGMAPLIPVKPIFQLLVFISLAAGIYGVFSIIRLAKGRVKAYQQTVVFLLVGLLASSVQFYCSLTLRGSTAPNNMRLYLTGITLFLMLVLRVPGIWQRSGFDSVSSTKGKIDGAGSIALFLCGLVTISTPIWVQSTHNLNGSNTANTLLWPLLLVGISLIIVGTGPLFILKNHKHEKTYLPLPEVVSNIE